MSDECDPEVYKNGTQVFMTNTIKSQDIETWVQKIASDSGQKVDWHFYAGRAVVLAIGDLKKVQQAILDNKNMHDKYYADEAEVYMPGSDHSRRIEGIWRYNGYGI